MGKIREFYKTCQGNIREFNLFHNKRYDRNYVIHNTNYKKILCDSVLYIDLQSSLIVVFQQSTIFGDTGRVKRLCRRHVVNL